MDCTPISGHSPRALRRFNDQRTYTIVCEIDGGTYVTQVASIDVMSAVKSWAAYLIRDEPIPEISGNLAEKILASLADQPPVALAGLHGVWCISANFRGAFMLANIIESA